MANRPGRFTMDVSALNGVVFRTTLRSVVRHKVGGAAVGVKGENGLIDQDRLEAPAAPSKRDRIIEAALGLFLEGDFDAVTMDAIAARAEVSKRTVYAYFDGKEALFSAAMSHHCRLQPRAPLDGDPPVGPPEEVLARIGRDILATALSPVAIATHRTVIAGAGQFPELARIFWSAGPERALGYLTRYLTEIDRQGTIVAPEPERTAMAFVGAAVLPFFLPLLLGVTAAPPGEEEIEAHLRGVVAAFLDGIRPRQRRA